MREMRQGERTGVRETQKELRGSWGATWAGSLSMRVQRLRGGEDGADRWGRGDSDCVRGAAGDWGA